MPALSAVVYRADGRIPRSRRGARGRRSTCRARAAATALEVGADVGGDSFSEVTFLAKVGNGALAGHRHRRQRAVPRVPRRRRTSRRARRVQYRAVVLDNARPHALERGRAARRSRRRRSRSRRRPTTARVRGDASRCARSRRRSTPNYVVTFERSVDGGAFTAIGTDDSSPVYTAFDDTSRPRPTGRRVHLPRGARPTRRAGRSTSDDAHRDGRAGAGDDGGRPLQAARPATTPTGACTCSATRSPTACATGTGTRRASATASTTYGARLRRSRSRTTRSR